MHRANKLFILHIGVHHPQQPNPHGHLEKTNTGKTLQIGNVTPPATPEVRKTRREVDIQERKHKMGLFSVKENFPFSPRSSKQIIWRCVFFLMVLTFNSIKLKVKMFFFLLWYLYKLSVILQIYTVKERGTTATSIDSLWNKLCHCAKTHPPSFISNSISIDS